MYIARISKPARCKKIVCEDDGSWRKSLEKKRWNEIAFFLVLGVGAQRESLLLFFQKKERHNE